MKRIEFIKMHGIGNDFVVFDCMNGDNTELDFRTLAPRLCERRFGIGADGLIAILPSKTADGQMRIINADGSEAQMCGNGIRCVARRLHQRTGKSSLRIATMSGIKTVEVIERKGQTLYTVDMGIPARRPEAVPVLWEGDTMTESPVSTSKGAVLLTAISMGNPHGVLFVDDISSVPVKELGRELECHSIWPEKANIEFAQVLPDRILMRTWERGVGETAACGTGACAVAVAAQATGRVSLPCIIELTGGILNIDMDDDGHILMTGPASETFRGTIEL